MRKILSLALVLALAISSALVFTACKPDQGNDEPTPPANDILGVYEMTAISGTVSIDGGEPIALEEGLYEYYTIELKADGKGRVEAAAAGSSSAIRQDVEWEYDEKTGALDIISKIDGMTVVEKMTLKDGKITYTNSQTGQNQGMIMTINMTIELQKKAD